MQFPGIIIGDRHLLRRIVSEEDTAGNYWNTNVGQLLSTPSLVAMMIEACTELVDQRLPDGFMSVGKSAQVVHEAPTVLGATVTMTVEIEAFDGYHIRLRMQAHDESGLISTGVHERSIVNAQWMRLKITRRLTDRI